MLMAFAGRKLKLCNKCGNKAALNLKYLYNVTI